MNKPFLDHSALVDHLAELGLDTGERAWAEQVLRLHGYHRLGGYRYLFREFLPEAEANHDAREYRADKFLPGSRLVDVVRLAEFDRELRELCLSGVMDFEIRLRTAIAHVLAARDPCAHLKPEHLHDKACAQRAPGLARRSSGLTKFERWRDSCIEAKRQARSEDFVVHHSAKYSGHELPVWATLELTSFGSLPFLMDLLKDEDGNRVAHSFGVRSGRAFTKWLRSFVDLRNQCAHGTRVFNRSFKQELSVIPSATASVALNHLCDLSGAKEDIARQRKHLYPILACLTYCLRSHESSTDWHLDLMALVDSLPEIVLPEVGPLVTPERNMGFPSDWQHLTLWSSPILGTT